MTMKRWTASILAAAGTVALATSSHAGGIFVPGAGPQAQARAGAFVAKADDPSAIYHNPAGFAKGEGTVILLGANLVDLSLSFERTGNYETSTLTPQHPWEGQGYAKVTDESKPALGFAGFQAIPLIAVTTDFGMDLKGIRFGAGLFAPHGFPERQMRSNYNFEDPNIPPPPSRYDVVSQEVVAAFPTIGASYSEGDFLDIGMRLSWGVASVKAQSYLWGIRNYEEDVREDGFIDLDVSDHFVPSFGVGVLYRPSKSIEVGAAYNSWATIDAKGTANAVLGSGIGVAGVPDSLNPVIEGALVGESPRCADGGIVGVFKACAKVKLPMTASIGGRYIFRDNDGDERGDIELDAKWENWSAASDVRVIVDAKSALTGILVRPTAIKHGFKDTFSIRLGGAYSFPMSSGKLTVRAGTAYDTAAAPNRWQRLDLDGASKFTLAAGLAYEFSRVRIDLGGGAVLQPKRTVQECNPDVGNPDCPNGDVPNPVQPLQGENNQVVSPFNGGTYKSRYTLLSLGVTTWF
jgi:long-chain fatty acid transport protein